MTSKIWVKWGSRGSNSYIFDFVGGKVSLWKSFIRSIPDNKLMVESVVIFQDGKEISISTHNKDIGRFTRQIKTADQVIFADSEVSRVASLILKNGGSHVRLEGININTQVLNEGYNKESLLSIKDMIDRGEFTAKMAAQQTAAGLDGTKLTDKQIASVGNQAAWQFQAQKLAQNFKDGMFERLTGQKATLPKDGALAKVGRTYTDDTGQQNFASQSMVAKNSNNLASKMGQNKMQPYVDQAKNHGETTTNMNKTDSGSAGGNNSGDEEKPLPKK